MLLQSEVAGVGRRIAATVLDLVILHLALSIVSRGLLLSPMGIWLLDFAIAVCYSALFLAMRGQTPGKMALGLRVISAGDGGLNYGQTFQRAVLKWLPVFGVFILLSVMMPEHLRDRTQQKQVIEEVEIAPGFAMASSAVVLAGTVLWLALIHNARRHPDGQAWHDRVAGTYVVKAM